jgi:UDP-N-acetylmuramoylalanine--D-glutamate ligase
VSRRRVIVVGFGLTGRAVARELLRAGDAVTVLDDQPTAEAREAGRTLGLSIEPMPAGAALGRLIAGADLIIPSPGVPVGHPIFEAARRADVPVRAEIELAAHVCEGRGAPRLLAITGTNGKTTVTTLVTNMLNRSGRRAIAAGNIGVPMTEAAR